jgi:hypothetical protein
VATAPEPEPAEDRGGGDRPRRPARRRGWRHRFRFTRRRAWKALLAVEVLVALAVSQALARDPSSFSLDGVERERFCPAVQRFRLEGSYQSAFTIESAPTLYDQQARAYRELAGSAPTDVRPDFDRLGGISEQLAATARQLQERQVQDPSFGAGLALTERQAEVSGQSVEATHRVEESIRQACGIDLGGPLPTTTAPVPGPTTTAVAPGTTAAG